MLSSSESSVSVSILDEVPSKAKERANSDTTNCPTGDQCMMPP